MSSSSRVIAPPPPPAAKPHETKAAEKPVDKPAAPKVEVAVDLSIPSPLCDGRQPRPTMVVNYWMRDQFGKLRCSPAWLIDYSPITSKWTINRMEYGRVMGFRDVSFASQPTDCCWTWPEGYVDEIAELRKEIAALKASLGK